MGNIARSMQYIIDFLKVTDIWKMVQIKLNKKDGTFELGVWQFCKWDLSDNIFQKNMRATEEQVLMHWITEGREDYSWWQHTEHTLLKYP